MANLLEMQVVIHKDPTIEVSQFDPYQQVAVPLPHTAVAPRAQTLPGEIRSIQ
jgi:hypothetical protein